MRPSSEWTNVLVPTDVNQDGQISAIDALIVINAFNRATTLESNNSQNLVDVNGDGVATAIDALAVINELHDPGRDTAVALAETLLQARALDWRLHYEDGRDDDSYAFHYETPRLEAAFLGVRTIYVDLPSGQANFSFRR